MKKALLALSLLAAPFAAHAATQLTLDITIGQESAQETLVLELGKNEMLVLGGMFIIEGELQSETDAGATVQATISIPVSQDTMQVLCDPTIELEWDTQKVFECPMDEVDAQVVITATRIDQDAA